MVSTLSIALNCIRHAGPRYCVSLSQIDQQIESRNLVQRMETTASASTAPALDRAATTSAITAVQTAGMETIAAGKLQGAKDPSSASGHPGPLQMILSLSELARVVTTCDGALKTEFSTCLQILQTGVWATVACYEYRRGNARRYMYYANGEIKPFNMDLPASVVQEMANEDFQRNWALYSREFERRRPAANHTANAS